MVSDMKNIIIRKTEETDAEQYVKLHMKVWRSAYGHFMPEEIFTDNETKMNERISNFRNRMGEIDYVATDGEKIIAFVVGKSISQYEHYEKLGYSELTGIYIDPDYQHIGLGKKLFDLIVSELRKLGKTKMVIGVLKDNLQARKAYEKWGCELDTYEKPFEKMGHVFPEVFYIFNLQKEQK